jgi:hypothetical protein
VRNKQKHGRRCGNGTRWLRRRAGERQLRLVCTFCGRHQAQVKKLIAGPGVYICGGCIAVTPCNANSAPSVCPATGYPANSLGTINLKTGAVANVAGTGFVTPKGMIFVP